MKQIVIFASGSGSTFEYLVEQAGGHFQVAALFCNQPTAGVIERAKTHHIPVVMIDQRDQWREELTRIAPDLIVLAGYLKLLPADIAQAYAVINTHPALLPAYGGKGFYGERVHQAVLAAGETRSGVSVHWVDEAYDRGEIIAQREVAVEPGDDAESLAARVQAVEKPLLLHCIKEILEAM